MTNRHRTFFAGLHTLARSCAAGLTLLAGLGALLWAPGSVSAGFAGLALVSHPARHDPSERPSPRLVSPPRFDPATGRDLANYPPAAPWDILHMCLRLELPDPRFPRFSAEQTLTVRARSMPAVALSLDARSTLAIASVTVDGKQADFRHEGEKLVIAMPATTEPAGGEPRAVRTVVTTYTADRPSADEGGKVGLVWADPATPEAGAPPEAAAAGAEPLIYSQGQANWNSLWFPCHDFPNERMTSELIVSVPDGLDVISNGRLESMTARGAGRLKTWRWLQDKPQPAYLVMLAVGRFDVADVGGPETARPGLAMPVYGPPGSKARLASVFARTPEMVRMMEELTARPYPWDKYAQVIVRDFRWAGMENTSATVLYDRVLTDGTEEAQALIVHELAHQWFGNLITCASWEHTWLNEGFATYFEGLWIERTKGPEAYGEWVAGAIERLSESLTGTAPRAAAMVSRRYVAPDDVFEKPEDPYQRGAVVLHMLRRRLGDEAFWRGVRGYLERGERTGLVETDDLRRALEEASGHSLTRFFEQWCHRPGMPRLRLAARWDEAEKTLSLTLDQTQPIDADNPAYELEVPVWVGEVPPGKGAQGRGQWVRISTDARRARATLRLDRKPAVIAADPERTLLATFETVPLP